jgi:AIPR protein
MNFSCGYQNDGIKENQMKNSVKTRPYNLAFHSIRNISAPEDLENGRTVYAGQATLGSILGIETDENVRGYLVEAEGKQKRTPSNVHKAIMDTLENRPSSFSVLNGGLTIVAESCVIDDKTRSATLTKATVINGAQTQAVIDDFAKKSNDISGIHNKFELIITSDEDLIGDISIARNFQNNVQLLLIAGRQGDLDELDAAFCRVQPNLRLQKPKVKGLIQLMILFPPKNYYKF